MPTKQLLDSADIRRALTRIAHEILERNRGAQDLVFAGMHTRGVPIAHRLSCLVKQLEKCEVSVGALDIGLYRDDIPLRTRPILQSTEFPVDINRKRVILVDDVLFTGRSIRAAMDALMDLGRPRLVQLAVLVDRGHREIPVRADYVGKNIPTSTEEEVHVLLEETDGQDMVIMTTNPGEMS